jgi:Glycosyl hydrolase family 76
MPNSPDYLSQAVTAAGILTDQWFPPSAPAEWVPDDYWRAPVICTLLTDLMTQTNKVDYTATIEAARVKGEWNLTNCMYYDDLTWWGRLFMHAYDYFKSQSKTDLANLYLADAKVVCDQLSQGWDQYATPEYCGGGIWWMREWFAPEPPYDPKTTFKASNSTLGFMETALALYLELGDQTYLDLGQKCWDWLVQWKFLDDQGMIWGALIPGKCELDPENVPVLSLQGEGLAPLWMLYKATNKTEYLDVADKVAEGTMAKMVWEGTQIMQDRCDAKWDSQTNDWKLQNSGDTPFKGLFATYLGEYTRNVSSLRPEQAAKYAAFLRANADAVWTNYPGAIFGMDWHTLHQNYQPLPKDNKPIPNSDYVNASLQYSGICALAAAALVSS